VACFQSDEARIQIAEFAREVAPPLSQSRGSEKLAKDDFESAEANSESGEDDSESGEDDSESGEDDSELGEDDSGVRRG